jgi:hypothetical protein
LTLTWFQAFAFKCQLVPLQPCDALKNKGFPLLALTVVPDTNASDAAFAVVFSVSHVILDGHNYYQLLNMLSHGGEVGPLYKLNNAVDPWRLKGPPGFNP